MAACMASDIADLVIHRLLAVSEEFQASRAETDANTPTEPQSGDIQVTICQCIRCSLVTQTDVDEGSGAILAVTDWISRTNVANGKAPMTVKDILEAMIMAHEIQGCLALENSFNRVGLGKPRATVPGYTTDVVSRPRLAGQGRIRSRDIQAFGTHERSNCRRSLASFH